jgi:hypothetical protein
MPSTCATSRRCLRNRITFPCSQSLSVDSSTPQWREAAFRDQPRSSRLAVRRSETVRGSGRGLWPRKRMIAGRRYNFGTVRPFSQLMIDRSLVSKSFPTSSRVNFRSSRRFLMCSPNVVGRRRSLCGFKHLSLTETSGKKATRPWICAYAEHWNCVGFCQMQQI